MDQAEQRETDPSQTDNAVAAQAVDRRGMSRRVAVVGIGAAGTIGLLAACGSDKGGSDKSGGTDKPGGNAAQGGTPSAGGQSPGATSPGGTPPAATQPSPGGTKVMVSTSTDAIPVNGGLIFVPQQVVVTQPVKGTFKAFSAICTHQGCPVKTVDKGVIICPCHGSQFSAKDGSVKKGPATRPLKPLPVTVKGDELTVTDKKPDA